MSAFVRIVVVGLLALLGYYVLLLSHAAPASLPRAGGPVSLAYHLMCVIF